MRVLVVEDEEDLGAVFREFLFELGHQPVIVRSAEAALGALQSERLDAIILDIHLPGMSGLDFLQLRPIRESGLPIVAVSGVATESQARECLRLGALDFVAKPVPLDRLSEVLTFLEPHALYRRDNEAVPRPERRRSLRARVSFPARIVEYKGMACHGTGVELSASGVKVDADISLSPGTAVKVCFTPPDGGAAIEVISLVVRADRDGIAFAFVNLPPHESRRLTELVQRFQDR
jgi:DNA-binding response OmpR family regulator